MSQGQTRYKRPVVRKSLFLNVRITVMSGQLDCDSSTAGGVCSAFLLCHFPVPNLPPTLFLENTIRSMVVGKAIGFSHLELVIHLGKGRDLEQENNTERKS